MNLLKKAWLHFSQNFSPILILYSLVVLVVSFQSWLLEPKMVNGLYYTQYNNYVIFKQSFFHLIQNQDIYKWYLQEQWDLYKYSPTFSLLFGPLAVLPDIIGLIVWNSLNAILIVYAIRLLPGFGRETKIKMLLFVLIELVTSMQNLQSNGLMLALILLGFCLFERGQFFFGIFCIVLTVYIKVYGILALGLLLFYPDKLKLALYTLSSFVILLILPLLVISPHQLAFLYQSWWDLLQADHSASYGLSVMGWLTSWFHFMPNKTIVSLIGLFFLVLPFAWWKRFSSYAFRVTWLASVLIWMIIFNHKAESPTFIIAVCGVIIWYYSKPFSLANFILIILVFVFTILSPTDVFPNYVQDNFFDIYMIKVVPCIICWCKITYEAIFWRGKEYLVLDVHLKKN
jgi:hypothetical protein